MTEALRHSFYNIPPEQNFLEILAKYLIEQHKDNPIELAQTLLLLPTRRSVRQISEIFLRISSGKPMLLPRIYPISGIDEDAEIDSIINNFDNNNSDNDNSGNDNELELQQTPPVGIISKESRLGILTRLIIKSQPMSPAHAYQLAIELARILDEATQNGIAFSNLEKLAPLELAEHWKRTTDFLKIITYSLPLILSEINKQDATSALTEKMNLLAKKWQNKPPDFSVIAAGSTGSIPATANLLSVISKMKNGMVILPGLDKNMPDEAWQMIDTAHPQYGIKQLLEKTGVYYQDIPNLIDIITENNSTENNSTDKNIATTQNKTIRTLFAPAPLTAKWKEEISNINPARDLSHIKLIEAETQSEEARIIAYNLRLALETPEKTAAFITPDRTLAAMVSEECKCYGLNIDDSAGKPLLKTPVATFMRLICETSASGAAPKKLLALLQHPLAALGENLENRRAYKSWIEQKILRGARLKSGMDILLSEIISKSATSELVTVIKRLRTAIRPLDMIFLREKPVSLAEIITLHCQAAENIATTVNNSGSAIIWRGANGSKLAKVLAKWQEASADFPAINPKDYPALFTAFLAQESTRLHYGTHPRLHILNPMEARLLNHDLVIIGAMNEGTWPNQTAANPWMSVQMREAFGLPSSAAHVGRSAHDLWTKLHGKEVILTRARKYFGAPQEESRWLIRLDTLLRGANKEDKEHKEDKSQLEQMNISSTMHEIIKQRANSKTQIIPQLSRPIFSPPLESRPRKFSVSSIDLWHKEPYGFYAKNILKLRSLPPLDQEPDAAEFGKIIHHALELFSKQYPKHIPDNPMQLLLACGQQVFQKYIAYPAVMNLWYPRFEAIAKQWLIDEAALRHESERNNELYHTESEVIASWKFTISNQENNEEITLNARADRVDIYGNNFRLIDYKTGNPPARSKIEQGEAKQLPLTAITITESGDISKKAKSLAYWGLKPTFNDEFEGNNSKDNNDNNNNKNYIEITNPENLITNEKEELLTLIKRSIYESDYSYEAAKFPLIPEEYNDYAHLIRRGEWGN